jgi:molybdopterin/thiamine biosynthesis adenylyltransferase/rhodanese-related sulfurtransferase
MNERYSRQIALKDFGQASQQKLSAAKVLVIGAGGLGCPALQYLAGAGIGSLGIVDGDHVGLTNLHRQVLYHTADIGRPKVEIASEKLTASNAEIKINTYPVFISVQNILEIIDPYDIVLDCSDNFATRYLINDTCVMLGKSLIIAAIAGYQGQLAVFAGSANSTGTNYRDLFPVQPEPHEIPNCEDNGVLGVLPGIMGTMQAAEAIKLLTNIGKPLIDQLLIYDLLEPSIYKIHISPAAAGSYTLPKNNSELLQNVYDEGTALDNLDIVEIDGQKMEELLLVPSTLVIDVREKYELPVLDFTHVRIPMSVFQETDINTNGAQTFILICPYGMRSMTAARLLKQTHGSKKNIYNLKGGLARWNHHLQTS